MDLDHLADEGRWQQSTLHFSVLREGQSVAWELLFRRLDIALHEGCVLLVGTMRKCNARNLPRLVQVESEGYGSSYLVELFDCPLPVVSADGIFGVKVAVERHARG